jgi:hypothetical protein
LVLLKYGRAISQQRGDRHQPLPGLIGWRKSRMIGAPQRSIMIRVDFGGRL